MRTTKEALIPYGLAAVSLAFLLPGLGAWSGLVNTTEVDCTQAIALEMRERGEFLIPCLRGEIYPDKPPLYWWMVLLTQKLLGVSLFSLRLPAAISMAGAVALTAVLARRLGLGAVAKPAGDRSPDVWRPGAAVSAALLSLGTAGLSAFGRVSIIDVALTFFTMASFAGLADWLLRRRIRGLYLCAAASGLSMMCKWPVAPAVIGFALAVWIVWNRDWDLIKETGRHWAGALAVTLAIAAPWNILMALRYPADFWGKVFVAEFYAARFITNANVPVMDFVVMCLTAAAPWTLLLLASFSPRGGERRPFGPEDRLLLTLMAASFIPFAVQKLKAERYVLFLVPLLAIWIVKRFRVESPLDRWTARLTGIVLLAAGLAAGALAFWFRKGLAGGSFAVLFGLLGLWSLWTWKPARAGAASAGLLAAVLGLLLPAFGPSRETVRTIQGSAPARLVILGDDHALWYLPSILGRSVRTFRDLSWLHRSIRDGRAVAVSGDDLPRLEAYLTAVGARAEPRLRWSFVTLSHAPADALREVLLRRDTAPLAKSHLLFDGFSPPEALKPLGRAVAEPGGWFGVAPGAYLAYARIDCPELENAGRLWTIGSANLVSDEGDILAGQGFLKTDFIKTEGGPAAPKSRRSSEGAEADGGGWFIWPFVIDRPKTVRVILGSEKGNPPFVLKELRLLPADPAAVRTLKATS